MKKNSLIVLALAFYIAGCTGPANTVKQGTSVNALKPDIPGRIRMLVPWEKGRITVQCAAVETDSAGYKLQSVAFYSDSVSNSSLLFVQKGREYPIAIFPINDDARNLLTVWDDSREYKVRVYGFDGSRVSMLFEDDSKTFPELFYEKKEMNNISILITNTGLVRNKKTRTKDELPVNASLYRWNGSSYSVITGIPWAKRFAPVK